MPRPLVPSPPLRPLRLHADRQLARGQGRQGQDTGPRQRERKRRLVRRGHRRLAAGRHKSRAFSRSSDRNLAAALTLLAALDGTGNANRAFALATIRRTGAARAK